MLKGQPVNIKPITVALLGVDERSKSAYQLFFEKSTPVRFKLIDDYRKAQVCLIDKDAFNIQQKHEDIIQRYPEKYTVVLSIIEHNETSHNQFFLKKPVKSSELQSLLNKVSNLISSVVETKPDKHEHTKIIKPAAVISQDKAKAINSIKQKEPVKPAAKVKQTTVVAINKTQQNATANAGKLLKVEHEEYFVGNCPDINSSDPAQLAKIFYTPERLLQGVMEQACVKSHKDQQIIQLTVLNNVFYFDAEVQKVYSTAGASIIRPLCTVQHNNQVLYDVKQRSFREETNFFIHSIKNKIAKNKPAQGQYNSWNMQNFMWLIALWCSRGRIPHGLDLTEPIYLLQWPNLTRLEPIPHAVRIAALIYQQPQTLIDIAKQLAIEQRYVFSFFSASKSIGLSDVSQRDAERFVASENTKSDKEKFILSKLLARLVNFR